MIDRQSTDHVNLKALFYQAFSTLPRPLTAQILRPVVTSEGAPLRELLASKTEPALSVQEVQTVVESNLWMLAPEAFLYFLPAFMDAALSSYAALSVFASELVGALTHPARADVVEAFERLSNSPPGLGIPAEMRAQLHEQQLEWADSGSAETIFRERFASLTSAEGAAILAFFAAFEKSHGANFPFDELAIARDRYWLRYS